MTPDSVSGNGGYFTQVGGWGGDLSFWTSCGLNTRTFRGERVDSNQQLDHSDKYMCNIFQRSILILPKKGS